MVDENFSWLSDVMEKMIDSQIANTQALTSLKDSLENTTERMKAVEAFFANGFRSDIKKIIYEVRDSSKELQEAHKKLGEIVMTNEELKTQNNELMVEVVSYKKVGFWMKAIFGFILTLAAIIAGIVQFL